MHKPACGCKGVYRPRAAVVASYLLHGMQRSGNHTHTHAWSSTLHPWCNCHAAQMIRCFSHHACIGLPHVQAPCKDIYASTSKPLDCPHAHPRVLHATTSRLPRNEVDSVYDTAALLYFVRAGRADRLACYLKSKWACNTTSHLVCCRKRKIESKVDTRRDLLARQACESS